MVYLLGSVNSDAPHFELCHGPGDGDPATWRIIALVGGNHEILPTVDFSVSVGLPDVAELRAQAELELQALLHPSTERTAVRRLSDMAIIWRPTLEATVRSSANWYGELHWRARAGTPR